MKIIESDFEYRGYRCVTIFTDWGYRCGYVGIPESHPLYGKDHNALLDITLKELADDEEMGIIGNRGVWTLLRLPEEDDEKISLGSYFMVHGGISYADGGKDSHHPVDSDLWWLGFDCGHHGDCPDYDLLEKTWGDNEMVRHRLNERWLYQDYEVRDLKYAQQNCRDLVDQIINLYREGKI